MRMKGINLHDIDPAPATRSTGIGTASQDGRNASVLPAIIQSEAVSISPVVLCPAATSVSTNVANSNKRQKTEDSIPKAVSHSRQSTSGVKVVSLRPQLCCLPLKLSNCTMIHLLLPLHAVYLDSGFNCCP